MSKRRVSWILIFMAWSGSAWGAEILWLKLTPRFSYKDLSTACSNEQFPSSVYWGAEIEGDRVIRAVLRDNVADLLASAVTFEPGELSGVALFRDSEGRVWVETLSLSTRLLHWIFFHGGGIDGCKPSQPLLSVEPAPFRFVFDMQGVGPGGAELYSQSGNFSGRRKDGGAYQARLALGQRQYAVQRDLRQ